MSLQKLKLFACIFVILFSGENNIFGQSLDSLQAELAKSKEDSAKVKLLLKICSLHSAVSDSEKIVLAKRALQLAKKINLQRGILSAQMNLGAAANGLGKYDEALMYLNEALKTAEKIPNNKFPRAFIYNSMGNAYSQKGDYTVSLSYYLKSLTLHEELNNRKEIAIIAHNVSSIYFENGEYAKAIESNYKAYGIFKQLKDTLLISKTETQFAHIAYYQGKHDSAIFYFKKSLSYTDKIKNPGYSLANLMGMCSSLIEIKEFDRAFIYQKKALEIARKIGDQQAITGCFINLGREYSQMNNFKEAEKLLKQAIDLSKSLGAKETTAEAYLYLSRVYEKESDFKEALNYSKLCFALNDSLFNEQSIKQINTLSARYENEKREKAIALLNAELSEKQKKQEVLNSEVKQKNGIIMVLLLTTTLISVSIFLFLSRQKLKQKNKFQAQINEQQKTTATAVIQVQENERNRIAQELHDGIGTFLSTLKINLQALENNIPPEKIPLYKNNTELIDKTSAELRKITKTLSNEILQGNSLANALKEIAERINVSGIMRFDFLSHESEQKPDDIIEANLYRIAQELVNNCLKHSRATVVTLQLIDHGTSILLMLEDNGIGFDLNDTDQNSKQGMGLNNIKNRVNFLSGTFKIESIPKKGSTFIIEVQKKLS